MATERQNKQYKTDDIIAVDRRDGTGKAFSCKVISPGFAETRNGTEVFFQDEDVMWVLGKNKKWPNFVQF